MTDRLTSVIRLFGNIEAAAAVASFLIRVYSSFRYLSTANLGSGVIKFDS